MRPGNLPLPAERLRRYDSGPVTIDSTNGNTFFHGFGRIPSMVQVNLVCVTANNGYVIGDEIPIDLLVRVTAGNKDGSPAAPIRMTDQTVRVLAPSASVELVATTGAPAAVTISNFKLRVLCLDAFPIG